MEPAIHRAGCRPIKSVSYSKKELPAPEAAGTAEESGQSPPPKSNHQRNQGRCVDAGGARATARLAKPSSTTTATGMEREVEESGGQVVRQEVTSQISQGLEQSSVVKLRPEAASFVPGESYRKAGLTSTQLGPPGSREAVVAHEAQGEVEPVSRVVADEVVTEPRVAPIVEKGKSMYVNGSLEGVTVKFLVDTGAEATAINFDLLEKLPRVTRAAFNGKEGTLITASGERVPVRGPVPCKITVAGRTVLESVYATPFPEAAILGMPALAELGCNVTIAGMEVVPTKTRSIMQRLTTWRVRRVVAAEDVVIPARSEVMLPGKVHGPVTNEELVLEPDREANSVKQIVVIRSVAHMQKGLCPVRICNPTDSEKVVRMGEKLASAVTGKVIKEDNTEASQVSELPEHLRGLYDTTCQKENLAPRVQQSFRELLVKHANLFATSDADLGRTSLVTHDIDTGDAAPIRQPPRRVPFMMQPELDKEMSRMLEQRVVEPGQSPWASPVVLVRKKDGSIRFCVDYRRLNAVTRFDAYPLPRIDETIESLSGAKFFATLDMISGYWQVGLTEEARLKSAFTVRGGLYLWNVMPFGLCNAPSTFERLMETVLQGLQWKSCLVYLDDVVIFGRSEDELIARMDEVFTRLGRAGLKLKPRKCKFFARETEYLGHVVSEAGVAVSPDKITAITEWPVPTNVTEVRSFLGTASYYRRFVQDFATVAAPLHRLTDHGAKWSWEAQHQEAFERLKQALATTPVLKYPVREAPYVLDTDASLTGIGAVLSQIVDGQEMVLGYASRTLTKAEQNYCVTRRELLAVVHFTKHYRPYLYGRKFTIRTDHSSLQWLLNFKDPKEQLARWLETLSEYDFTIEHRPGKKHGNADGLSRKPCRHPCHRVTDPVTLVEKAGLSNGKDSQVISWQVLPFDQQQAVNLIQIQPTWTAEEFCTAQQGDGDLRLLILALERQEKPKPDEVTQWSPTARRYLVDWERLSLVNGMLSRAWFTPQGQEAYQQLIVPRKLVPKVLEMAHDNTMAGHFGTRRTLLRVRRQFYWMGINADIRAWCRSCQICCARKPKPAVAHHAAQRQLVTEPLQRVAVDILGPIEPPTKNGNRYVLVVVDYLTKWAEALPMTSQTAEECAKVFVTEFVCRLGAPQQLHSDQGRQFESALFQQVCQLLGTLKTRTTPLHPQSDGQTERCNRTLLDILAKLTREQPAEWDEWLPYAMSSYRSSVHRVTGETPNRLMLGREVVTPMTLLAPPPPGTEEADEWVKGMHKRFSETYAKIVEVTRASHRSDAHHVDRRNKGLSFRVSDLVLLYDPKQRRGVTPKLDAERWTGPWKITAVISACVYAIRKEGTNKCKVVNVDRLVPFVPRDVRRFPPETHSGDEKTSESGEEEVMSGSSVAEESSAEAEATPCEGAAEMMDSPAPLRTQRNQRNRRPPDWTQAFDMSWKE